MNGVRRSLGTLALLALAVGAPRGAGAEELANVKECVEGNTPRLSSIQQLDLAVVGQRGTTFEAGFSLHWRRVAGDERRILLRFQSPEELEGAALLIRSAPQERPHVHIYLPELGKVRSITSRGELEGFLGQANLGIAELEILVDPVGGRGLSLLDAEALVGDRRAWRIETRDEGRSDARYPRIVQLIDREFCIPLRAEFYDASGELARSLEVAPESVARTGGSWLPRALTFHDPVRETRTRITVSEVEVDVPFSAALLTPKALQETLP